MLTPSQVQSPASPEVLSGKKAALRFVELLTGAPDTPMRVRLLHARDRHAETRMLGEAPLKDHARAIQAAQKEHFDPFLVVNGGGESDAHVDVVRALYIDMDGRPLPETWHVQPDFLVMRDATHWHAYWLVGDMQTALFKQTQRQLIEHYGSDPSVCNLSRVMRIPGFLHQKGGPVPITMIDFHPGFDAWEIDRRPLAELTAALPPPTIREHASTSSGDDPNRLQPASFRKLLSYIPPELRPCDHPEGGNTNLPPGEGGRHAFVGIMQHIISGDGVRPELEETWDGEEEACRFADGTRWGERAGDPSYRPVNWTYDTDEDCLADVRRSGEPEARILTATLVRLANFNGYAKAGGKLNDDDPTARFAGVSSSSATTGYPAPKSAAELAAGHFPRADYLWEKFILRRFVNLLYGDGGTGKTLLAEHIAVAVAAGVELFGLKVQRQPVLLVLAEDDDGETKARLEAICALLGVNLADLPIKTWCLPGWDAAIAHITDDGSHQLGEFMEPLRAELASIGPCFLVLDTVSDIATLDENKRLPVNKLCKVVLTGLCREFEATILVNAHPSKAAMADGTHYAGGTAWNNAVRNRLMLIRPKPGSSQRILRVAKANYGEAAELELYQVGLTLVTAPEAGHTEAEERTAVLTTVLEMLDKGVTFVRANGAGQKPTDLAKAIYERHGLLLEAKAVLNHLNTLERHGHLQYEKGGNGKRNQKAGFRRPVASSVASPSQALSQGVASLS